MNARYDYILDVVAIASTAMQTENIFKIISLVLTCLSVAASLALTIYKWYKTAKADGKITADEVMDVVGKVKDATDEIKDKIDKEGVKK